MKRQLSLLLLISYSSLVLSTAQAGPAPNPVPAPLPPSDIVRLSIAAAVQTAMQNNPVVQGSREKLHEVDADVSGSYSLLFPNISALGAGSYKKDSTAGSSSLFGGRPYNQYSVSVTATQPIWASGAFSGGIGLAKSTQKIANIDKDTTERDLILNVVTAFYNLILSERAVETLERNASVDQTLLKTIQEFQRVGRAQLLDVLQIKTQIALLVPKIAAAKNQVQINASQLAILLGDRSVKELEVRGTLNPPDRKAVESSIRKDETHVLEIERASELLTQLDNQNTVLLAKDLPNLALVGAWGRSTNVKTDLLNDNLTAWSISLQLSVPIFSGLSSIFERRAMASQLAQLELSRTNVIDQTTLAQIEALKQLDLSGSTIESSRVAYDLAVQSLAEAQRNYRLGTSNLLQYLQSEQSLLDAESAYDQAKYTYIISIAKYLAAMGYPLDDFIQKLETKS